jgi:hypothetical protein
VIAENGFVAGDEPVSRQVAAPEPSIFWGRQFAPSPTGGQIVFDVAFGIALPLICLVADPIVFRESGFGRPLLDGYLMVAGGSMGLGLLSLVAWLSIRNPPSLLAGLLAGGAVFASLLGLVLLPYSLFGLIALIGILGFSPFLTAFVFWRNAVRAFRRGRQGGSMAHVAAVLGFVLACGVPVAAQMYVDHEVTGAMEMVLSDDAAAAKRGLAVLKRFRAFAQPDRLVLAYESEREPARQAHLAETYRELTGSDIEYRLAILND